MNQDSNKQPFKILRRKRERLESGERATRRARRKQATLKVLPSLFTMGNAVCGFAAIVQVAALQYDPQTATILNPENLTHAGWLLILGMLFDGVDGRIARMTNTTGDFGGELDSLCDAVSFGVAPAVMVVMTNPRLISSELWWRFAWISGLVFVCGAILRLARFNAENQGHAEEAHQHFKGLPSPAAAGLIATLAIFQGYLRNAPELTALFSQAGLDRAADKISLRLPFAAIAGGWLMVSPVRYVHFGNRFLRGRQPAMKLARTVLLSILVFALFPEVALTLLFFGFALSGPFASLLPSARGRNGEAVRIPEDSRGSLATSSNAPTDDGAIDRDEACDNQEVTHTEAIKTSSAENTSAEDTSTNGPSEACETPSYKSAPGAKGGSDDSANHKVAAG